MDVHLSNILSPIIEAVADNMKMKDEVISTDAYNLKQSQSLQCRDVFEPEESHSDSDTSAEYVFVDVLDEVLGDSWVQEQPAPGIYVTLTRRSLTRRRMNLTSCSRMKRDRGRR